MKKIILIISIMIFSLCINVHANIICNDGHESETCKDCHQGCCSGHQGCLKEKTKSSNDYLKYIAYGAGATGVAGVGAAGYLVGRKSNKS